MTYLFIGFSLIVILSWIMLQLRVPELLEFACSIFMIIGFIGLFFSAVGGYFYHAAEYQADIVNREYGTSYTQEEIFYASNVIERIQEIKRQRLEVNGNVITGENK